MVVTGLVLSMVLVLACAEAPANVSLQELPPGGLPEVEPQPLLSPPQPAARATDSGGGNVHVQELPPGGLPEVEPQPLLSPPQPAARATDSGGGNVHVQELPPSGLPEVEPQLRPLPSPPEPAARATDSGGGNVHVQVVDPDAVSVKVLGSKCNATKDCISINNTNCINGICDCISGFIPSKHSLEKCIKVPAGLEDTCEEEAQCSHVVAGSECRGGRCACPPNYVPDMARCWERQLLGGRCNVSVQCDNVALSLCAQGVCACQPPLIPNANSNKCLQSAGRVYRALCEEDIQCTDSYGDEAHCSNSQCVCSNNYHFNGSLCVADKKFGESCTIDADCTVSDVNHVVGSRACIAQVCGCADGYVSLPGEDICLEKSTGEELAVSLSWIACIIIAKFYLS